MRTALIVSTYQWTEALACVLESVNSQNVSPDEVVVVGDGSLPAVGRCVREFAERCDAAVRYVWQPDTGFRVARARNLAVLKSAADHLIFVDGDCILPPNFVEQHRRLSSSKSLIVAGGRVLLSHETTACHLKDASVGKFDHWKFSSLPLGPLRDLSPDDWTRVRGCNFSVSRDLFESVSGFDETYSSWGFEDSDLIVRMLRVGGQVRSGRLAACVKHLDHGVSGTMESSENLGYFQSLLQATLTIHPRTSVFMSH